MMIEAAASGGGEPAWSIQFVNPEVLCIDLFEVFLTRA